MLWNQLQVKLLILLSIWLWLNGIMPTLPCIIKFLLMFQVCLMKMNLWNSEIYKIVMKMKLIGMILIMMVIGSLMKIVALFMKMISLTGTMKIGKMLVIGMMNGSIMQKNIIILWFGIWQWVLKKLILKTDMLHSLMYSQMMNLWWWKLNN